MSEPMAYVGSFPDCGCIVFVAIDDPAHRAEVIEDVKEHLDDGLDITRMSVAEAKAHPAFFRECGGPSHR